MAPNLPSSNHKDEDYIDIEVSSTSHFLCYSTNSPPKPMEFEFQKSSAPNERAESTPSPADELFYKGKLLPLHLPPRLQMVQNLLQNSSSTSTSTSTTTTTTTTTFQDENFVVPFGTTNSTNTSTPLESCNISPSESCRVSCELNPDEYFFEWSTELSGFICDNNPKKSWSKKLKLIKQSLLAQKLKASRTYLRNLFTKSACSNDNAEAGNDSKGKECLNKYIKVGKKGPFGQIGKGAYPPTLAAVMKSFDKEMGEDGVNNNTHRKSFSGAIKRRCATKCSSSSSSSSGSSSLSSSFSINSNGLFDLQLLKRSSSASSELESSVEGAIAHCKKSQHQLSTSKTSSEVGLCSLSASRIAVSEDKER